MFQESTLESQQGEKVMLSELEMLAPKFHKTCSIDNPINNSVTFIRSLTHIGHLRVTKKNLIVLAPSKIDDLPKNITIIPTRNPEYEFTLFHHWVLEKNSKLHSRCATLLEPETCNIHPTALIGEDGLKYILDPDGKKIKFKHSGQVIIFGSVDIGAYSIIHRGTLDSTVISSGVKIGDKVNIGHNNNIMNDTVIAPGTITSGSVNIGRNCWIGVGCIIKHYINICDNVILGAGSVVVKDIEQSGIYVGNPLRRIKGYPEGFNF